LENTTPSEGENISRCHLREKYEKGKRKWGKRENVRETGKVERKRKKGGKKNRKWEVKW
jgi:hypothetical protein